MNKSLLLTVVVFLCFLLTISTAFEYKLSQKFVYIDPLTHKSCPENLQNMTIIHQLDTNQSSDNELSPSAVAIIAIQSDKRRQINTIPVETTTIIIPNNDNDNIRLPIIFNETTIDDNDGPCEEVSFFFIILV